MIPISIRHIENIIKADKIIVQQTNEPFRVNGEVLAEIYIKILAKRAEINDMSIRDRDKIIKFTAFLISEIAFQQPFTEGNKRTGFAFGKWYLSQNGYSLPIEMSDDKELTQQEAEWRFVIKEIPELFENDDRVSKLIQLLNRDVVP